MLGCFLRYPDPGVAELLSCQGWDFVVLDAEHGTLEPRDCENMVRAVELRRVTPIVRVTRNEPSIILRFLDTGAQGLHVPMVNSAAEAEAAVRSVKYCPRGTRGLAGVRAADYAQGISFKDYVRQANAETVVVIQLETTRAVESLREIVEVEGVDVFFIGPLDLSHSIGVPGQLQHPSVEASVQRITEIVLKSKAVLGVLADDVTAAQQWRKRGARYIVTGLESLLAGATRSFLDGVGDPEIDTNSPRELRQAIREH